LIIDIDLNKSSQPKRPLSKNFISCLPGNEFFGKDWQFVRELPTFEQAEDLTPKGMDRYS